MKIEWNEYQEWPDGSKSTSVDGTLYIGGKKYQCSIEDHTLEDAKADDKEIRRRVTHAFVVSGLPYYIGSDVFYKNGFGSAHGCSSVGIDENPGFEDETSPYEYVGTPRHTIKDVERLVEKCFIEAFKFDYDEELKELMENLNKRKALMEEAEEYEKIM